MSENQYPTQPNHTPAGYEPLDETEKPKRKRRWVTPLVALGAGAFVGGLVGGAGGAEDVHDHGPVPTETVTATAEAPDTSEEVKELEAALDKRTDELHAVTEERDNLNAQLQDQPEAETPQACLDALDSAESIYSEMSQIGDVLVAYIEIIEQFDTYGYISDADVQKFSDAVVLNQQVNEAVASHGADFNVYADECRSASN